MKNSLILFFGLFLLLFVDVQAHAQVKGHDSVLAGVYSTYEDFKNGKLSYETDCERQKQKIRLYAFIEKPYIEILHKGNKIKLFKGELFGYQNCEGSVFRFYCNQEYELAEIGKINLYFMDEDIPYGSTFIRERNFYFCREPNGPLFPLTIHNLKMTFPENQRLHKLLDDTIKNERTLSSYDNEHQTFMINRLYFLSEQ